MTNPGCLAVMTIEPAWLVEARLHIGVKEIKGSVHNSVIAEWLNRLKAWWADDETPWCGVFAAHCMRTAGFAIPRYWMRAKAWLDWGCRINKPAHGCVVVFDRIGGGHVGFVVGSDRCGNLMVLGGNQGDAVSIKPFPRERVVGYRWPCEPSCVPPDYSLPVVDSDGRVSERED